MNILSINQLEPVQINSSNTSIKIDTEENSFSSYLSCTKSLEDIFQDAAATYDVPVNLLKAVAKAESEFNPNAVSHCGAQGIMQLMPATASYLGVEDAFDPEQNIMGGAKYLSSLLKTYDGDVTLALAAYNAGSGNVKKYGGVPPFKETQNYIKKISGFLNQNFSLDTVIYSTKKTNTVNETTNIQNSGNTKNVAILIPNSNTKNTSTKVLNNNTENISERSYTTISSNRNLISDISFHYEDYMRFLEIYTGLSLFEDSEESSTAYQTAMEVLTFSSKRLSFLSNDTKTDSQIGLF